MNLWFGKAHLETLKRLEELCDKHGGRIVFGVEARAYYDELESDIEQDLFREGILINDDYGDLNYDVKISTKNTFWLEYHDKEKKLHNLIYSIYEYTIVGDSVNNEEYDSNWFSDSHTTITSTFDTSDQSVHLCRPYRWGVVLGSFANHVANLLDEPNKMQGITY
jgi:hypothetical protein